MSSWHDNPSEQCTKLPVLIIIILKMYGKRDPFVQTVCTLWEWNTETHILMALFQPHRKFFSLSACTYTCTSGTCTLYTSIIHVHVLWLWRFTWPFSHCWYVCFIMRDVCPGGGMVREGGGGRGNFFKGRMRFSIYNNKIQAITFCCVWVCVRTYCYIYMYM